MRERPPTKGKGDADARITPARAGKTHQNESYVGGGQDHPRSCGKDKTIFPKEDGKPGSPPLVRERPLDIAVAFDRAGITPARAGKTNVGGNSTVTGKDHPRSCGKDAFSLIAVTFLSGSPPLVRERRFAGSGLSLNVRITPARAGKTQVYSIEDDMTQDHPRSCGKDVLLRELASKPWGSPPLVRERHSWHIERL